jgi:hypothetical protein
LTETAPSHQSGGDHLRRYWTLAYGALGTMLDIGLVVVGTLLLGLAIATLLGGFGIIVELEDLSTGAVLGSALILAVVGLFALGIASEGPLGRGRKLVGFELWEVGIGRAIAAFLVGFTLLLLDGFLVGLIEDLPEILERGSDGIHSAAIAGMVAVPLVGVPLSLLIRTLPDNYAWLRRHEFMGVFVVWVVATLIGL